MNSDQHLYTLALFNETAKAILVGKDPMRKKESFWLPISQINIRKQKIVNMSQYVVVAIPEWLAEKHNLDVSLEGDILEDLE